MLITGNKIPCKTRTAGSSARRLTDFRTKKEPVDSSTDSYNTHKLLNLSMSYVFSFSDMYFDKSITHIFGGSKGNPG